MKPDTQPWCDGANAHSPNEAAYHEHPRVYFAYNDEGKAKCPYCGHQFDINDSTTKGTKHAR